MSHTWMNMIGPADSEPDYYDAIMELESIESIMANVATYDDYFVTAALANDNVPGARMRSGEETITVRAA